MTDAEILTLVDRLERCLLTKEEFHHRDHLTVAVVVSVFATDIETAMDRMRSSLKRFAAHHRSDRALPRDLDSVLAFTAFEKRLDRSRCLEDSVPKCKSNSVIRTWHSSITAGSELIRRKRRDLVGTGSKTAMNHRNGVTSPPLQTWNRRR